MGEGSRCESTPTLVCLPRGVGWGGSVRRVATTLVANTPEGDRRYVFIMTLLP